jgi:hypothetical protein
MVKDYFKNKLFNLSKALSSTHPKIALRDWEYKPDPKNNVVHFSHRVHGVITVKPNTKESSKSDYPLIAVHNGASIGRFKTAGEAALGVAKYASSLGKKSFTRLYNIDPMKIKTKKSEYSEKNVLSHFTEITKNVPTMKQMLGPTLTPEHKEHIEWAKKLPNSNWQIWATKQYKNNPSAFTSQIKQKIEHFAGSQHIPEIAKVRFGKEHDLESGLNLLESAEKQYNERIKDNLNLVKPTARTKKLVQGKTKPNRHWYDLGAGSCSAEGKAMGHCGNAPSQVAGDRILSLRTAHKDTKGNVYHEPHLTFVLNNGFLGEMKGRGNEKPTSEYHKDIAELLKDKRIKGVIGGGYEPHKNFDFADLSPELQQEVRQSNPNLITLDENGIDKILSGEVQLPEKHKNIKIDLAKNPNLHPDLQAKLVNDPSRNIREAIARNPNLHPDLQAKLVNDKYWFVRAAIGYRLGLLANHHATLVNDSYHSVRRAIASNPNLHPDLQAKLVDDPEKYVRLAIAENPNLHPDHYDKLVNDPYENVRAAIAIKTNLHPDLQAKLVNDPSRNIREAIAENPNLHPDHQAKLVNDANWLVREAIAKNTNLHPDQQAKLVNDPGVYVRMNIASNPNLHPDLQAKLVNDPDRFVREAIAKNPNLHPDLQAKLMHDEDVDVRRAIAKNPHLHPDLRANLASDKKIAGRCSTI